MTKQNWMAAGIAILGVLMVGCTPQAREQYSEAGQKAQQATAETGKAAATDAKVTGEVVKDAAQESKQAADNSVMTGQVRLAISNAHNLHITDLNVDTVGKTIHLKGTAASQQDSQQAEALAKATAGGDYTVQNELTVGGTK